MGFLLDEYMSWNEQIYQIKLKLKCTIGILSKLCGYVNLNTLSIAYYSPFQSEKLIIQKLQNRVFRNFTILKNISLKNIRFWNLLTSSKFKIEFLCIRLNKIVHLLPLFLSCTPETNTITRQDLQPTCWMYL